MKKRLLLIIVNLIILLLLSNKTLLARQIGNLIVKNYQNIDKNKDSISISDEFGEYSGSVEVIWLSDQRMRLLKDFTYTDPNGLIWTAPEGYETDGASIPRWLWSLVGAPYTGRYRDAAVIHDVYCENKQRTWEVTHLAFYYAMRASRVKDTKAKTMYAGVYFFGPKWSTRKIERITSNVSNVEDYLISKYQPNNPESLINIVDVSRRFMPLQNRWITTANIEISPREDKDLKMADFKKLENLIKEGETENGSNSVTLEEIRSYKP